MIAMLFMTKNSIYAQKLCMLYVSYDLNHICVLFFKTCPFVTYICTAIGPTPKSFDYRLLGQFLNFSELPRQFKPNMSDLLARTYPASQTCSGIGLLAI
jgi:hypothetical protein